MSRRKYTVLSGSIFAYWNQIEHFVRRHNYNASIQVIRLKMTDGSKIVGVLMPDGSVKEVLKDLRASSKQVQPGHTVAVDDDENWRPNEQQPNNRKHTQLEQKKSNQPSKPNNENFPLFHQKIFAYHNKKKKWMIGHTSQLNYVSM